MTTQASLTQAIRHSIGLFIPFTRGLLRLRGKDRHSFLHNLLSHDIKGLETGQGRPACGLDRQGKILFSCFVHAEEEALLMELSPPELERARTWLDQHRISEQVQIEVVTDRYEILPLHGPKTLLLLKEIFPELEVPKAAGRHVMGPPQAGLYLAARTDLVRMPGIHLWVEPKRREEIRKRLVERGGPLGLQVANPEALETLRIEAGVPWPGKELSETVILNELGSDDWVSFTKGCFIGQEIVARIRYRAHPPRLLTGFKVEGDVIPPEGSRLQSEGADVGVITSACFSPTLAQVIALGFLRFGIEPKRLSIQTAAGPLTVHPTPLPFVP